MSKASSQSTDIDLRNFFRVVSMVKIRHCPITLVQIENEVWPESLKKSDSQQLMEALRTIEHDHLPTLRAISEQNRQLEHYLRSINKRFDLIGQYLHANSTTEELGEIQEVLMSEAGIELNIPNESLLEMGDYLALELILLPSHVSLALYAKVINRHKKEGVIMTGIEFINLKDAERQQLAKQVIQQQLIEKRKKDNKAND